MSKKWKSEETAELIRLYTKGWSLNLIRAFYEISNENERTMGAVNSKLHRLRKQNPNLSLLWRRKQ